MSDFVSPGQRFAPKAATWNNMVEVAQWYQLQKRLGDQTGGAIGNFHPGMIKVQNITGSSISSGEIVELGDLLVSGVRHEECWLEGDTYATGGLSIAVARNEIPDDGIGWACVSGVCKAIVDIQDTNDLCATPVNGAVVLDSCNNSPIKILYAPASTGEQECFVWLEQLCFRPLVRFTLSADLATTDSNKTATITHQFGRGIDNTTSSGGITVHNLADNTGTSYVFEGDTGDAGLAQHDYGTNYRIVNMECPT